MGIALGSTVTRRMSLLNFLRLTLFPLFVRSLIQKKDCGGPLKPEVIQGTQANWQYPAKNVLFLGEEDIFFYANRTSNHWLAENYEKTGQGFTIRVDTCARLVSVFM